MKKELKAPAEVIAQFSDWQLPKRGTSNPENQTNDVWSWLIETRTWPHAAHAVAGSGKKQSPGWSFDRYGQSKTQLPDGSIVYIGGEHEDSYDPDFYIYNDVIVVRPNGSIEIYGYPTDIFLPTDFHSATLCGDEIIILGGLRYPQDRNQNDTFAYRLSLSDFSIHRIETCGDAPPWLHDHKAKLDFSGKKIICTGGHVTHRPKQRNVENLTTWEFDLEAKSWKALMTKPFQRWLLVREDESDNELSAIENLIFANRYFGPDEIAEIDRAKFAKQGYVVDANLFDARFSPPIPHRSIESEEYNVHRIIIDGVTVRILEDMHEIAVTVEGQLKPDLIEALQRHGLETYSALEGVPYKVIHLLGAV